MLNWWNEGMHQPDFEESALMLCVKNLNNKKQDVINSHQVIGTGNTYSCT